MLKPSLCKHEPGMQSRGCGAKSSTRRQDSAFPRSGGDRCSVSNTATASPTRPRCHGHGVPDMAMASPTRSRCHGVPNTVTVPPPQPQRLQLCASARLRNTSQCAQICLSDHLSTTTSTSSFTSKKSICRLKAENVTALFWSCNRQTSYLTFPDGVLFFLWLCRHTDLRVPQQRDRQLKLEFTHF